MSRINAVIVDDEPLARINIREALNDHSNWALLAELSSARELDAVVAKLTPDVIFLDIQMPGENGIEVAKRVLDKKKAPLIIFVTAYDEYAINAFELYAIDYILKPFDDDRFTQALKRVESLLGSRSDVDSVRQWQRTSMQQQYQPLDKILIRSTKSIRIVNIQDVLYFASSGNYVEVHHRDGMHLHRIQLSYLETRLDPVLFFRVHRSTIVKVSEIRELKISEDNKHFIIISDGRMIKLSLSYKDKLLAILGS